MTGTIRHRLKPARKAPGRRRRLGHFRHHGAPARSAVGYDDPPVAAAIAPLPRSPWPASSPSSVSSNTRGQALADDLPSFEWMAAFDELDEPVFVHDAGFRILRCNAAYAKRAGLSMDALIGKPYWQCFPKLDGPLRHCADAIDTQGKAGTSEFTATGGEIFLSQDITARKPSGEFWYSRHLMENVSARRRQEEESRLRALFNEAMVAGMPGVLAVIDQNLRLVSWNGALREHAERERLPLRDAELVSLVAEDQRPKVAERLRQAFREGRAVGDLAFAQGEGCGPKRLFSARRFEQAGVSYVACIVLSEDVATRVAGDLAADKAISDSIIESAPGPYYVVDQNSKLTRWNHHLREMTGLGDSDLRGRSILSVIHDDDRPLAEAKLLAAFAMGYAQMEVRVLTARHGPRVLLKTARRFDIGGVPHLAGFCVDVTERKEAEAALAKKNAFTDALVNSVPGAFYVVDREGNYTTWNSYLNRLTGLSDTELRNRSSLLTIAEQDRPLAAAKMREAFEAGYAQSELHVLTRDRGERLYFMTARRFEVEGAAYLVGVGVDTTDRRARLQQLEQAAHMDPLTHVPNRGYFLDLATQEFSRSRRYGHPLSLWMIDVDHFKNVNDTWGHHAGDLALQALGRVGREALRDWDIMGRMGGEEFAVLLPDTDTAQALLVAERMRQKIATTSLALEADTTAHLTISIGVASMRDEDNDVARLLDRADHALLEAKRTGRDKVCVAESTS